MSNAVFDTISLKLDLFWLRLARFRRTKPGRDARTMARWLLRLLWITVLLGADLLIDGHTLRADLAGETARWPTLNALLNAVGAVTNAAATVGAAHGVLYLLFAASYVAGLGVLTGLFVTIAAGRLSISWQQFIAALGTLIGRVLRLMVACVLVAWWADHPITGLSLPVGLRIAGLAAVAAALWNADFAAEALTMSFNKVRSHIRGRKPSSVQDRDGTTVSAGER